jgi:hypothetical protein
MRAALFFLAFAFAFEDDHVASPTEDPDEIEALLIDEYSTGVDILPRSLQTYDPNATINPNATTTAPEESTIDPKMVAAGAGAVVAVGALGYFLTRPGHAYETYDYEHAANSGLLDDPDYEIEELDDSDYDEEYE